MYKALSTGRGLIKRMRHSQNNRSAFSPPPLDYYHIIWIPVKQIPQLKELLQTLTKESLGKTKDKGGKNKEILVSDTYNYNKQ